MSNSNIREFADQLSDVLMKIEDAKVEASAIIDAAREAGINVKALRKVARELVTDASKLAKRYADEQQLELFRDQVGIRKLKGLEGMREAAE